MRHQASQRLPRIPSRALALVAPLALAAGCATPNAALVELEPMEYLGAPAPTALAQDGDPATPGPTAREANDTNWEFRIQPGLRRLTSDTFEFLEVDDQLAFGVGVGFSPPEWHGFGIDIGSQLGIGYDELDAPADDVVLVEAEIYGGPRYTLIHDALVGGRLQPYIGGGITLISGNLQLANGDELSDESGGLYGVIGIQYAFSHFAIGTEFRMVRGTEFQDTDGASAIDDDLDYNQLSVVFSFRI